MTHFLATTPPNVDPMPAGGATVIVRSAVAPMHAEPRVSSPQVSQRLAGHLVRVVETDGEWIRARGEDDYDGWIHRGYLHALHEPTAVSGDRWLSLGCRVREPATGLTRALPAGAFVGGNEELLDGDAIRASARAERFPRRAMRLVETAVERFAGAPYQWGGVSPWGADCSGFVQLVFWLHGDVLPRDAWQQALVGRDAGSDILALAPADLIFFSDRTDRRITHVGIALGERRMAHLALGRGGYAVERLDAHDDPYVAALVSRFVSARRLY